MQGSPVLTPIKAPPAKTAAVAAEEPRRKRSMLRSQIGLASPKPPVVPRESVTSRVRGQPMMRSPPSLLLLLCRRLQRLRTSQKKPLLQMLLPRRSRKKSLRRRLRLPRPSRRTSLTGSRSRTRPSRKPALQFSHNYQNSTWPMIRK